MTVEPEVKTAGANLQANTISTIVLGFAADPMARWVWPDHRNISGSCLNSSGPLAAGRSTMAQPTSRKELAPPPYGCLPASSPMKRQWAQS